MVVNDYNMTELFSVICRGFIVSNGIVTALLSSRLILASTNT